MTHGVLLVGGVDGDSAAPVHAFGRTVAMPAVGLGDAAHWAAACIVCPPPPAPPQQQLPAAAATAGGSEAGSGTQ